MIAIRSKRKFLKGQRPLQIGKTDRNTLITLICKSRVMQIKNEFQEQISCGPSNKYLPNSTRAGQRVKRTLRRNKITKNE